MNIVNELMEMVVDNKNINFVADKLECGGK